MLLRVSRISSCSRILFGVKFSCFRSFSVGGWSKLGGAGSYLVWGGEESSSSSIPSSKASPDAESPVVSVTFGPTARVIITKNGNLLTYGGSELLMGGHGACKKAQLVASLPPMEQCKLGTEHAVALSQDGRVFTWGSNGPFYRRTNALGNNSASGDAHSLALTSEGKIYVWGKGEYNRLGTGSTSNAKVPTPVVGLDSKVIVAIAAAGTYSSALDADGVLYSWGRNDKCQLGLPTQVVETYAVQSIPAPIPFPEGTGPIAAMACGPKHMIACSTAGRLYVWGKSVFPSPTLMKGDDEALLSKNIVSVSAGDGFSACIDSEGTLYTFGDACSALGQNTRGNVISPTPVEGFGPGGELGAVMKVFSGSKSIAVITKSS